MKKSHTLVLSSLLFLALTTPALAQGHWHKNWIKRAPWGQTVVAKPIIKPTATSTGSTSSLQAKPTAPKPAPKPATTTPPVVTQTPAGETRFTAYITGYSYWDNTPAASAEISHPVIHKKAGGSGTFTDPVTVAVGHSIISGKDILDYKQGTKFYVPNLRKYFIVEDTCGDGNNPQAGPCHTGYKGNVWLDVYVDGATASQSKSDSCMDAITKTQLVILNPTNNYKVVAGDLSANCAQYGNTLVTN